MSDKKNSIVLFLNASFLVIQALRKLCPERENQMNHQDYLCVPHMFTSRWLFKISFCPSVTYVRFGRGECKVPSKKISVF